MAGTDDLGVSVMLPLWWNRLLETKPVFGMDWSMTLRHVLCVLAAILLTGCVIHTRGSNVPLEVTAELNVDGRQISQTWFIPGVPARENPYSRGSWFTYPAFGTVLVRLPTGEALWIDVNDSGAHVPDIIGETVTSHSNAFYFIDSVANPQTLTDHFNNTRPGSCPPDFRIRNCDIAVSFKRLPDGPATVSRDVGGGDGVDFGYPDSLRAATLSRVRPIFFLSLRSSMHKVPGAKQDAVLGTMLRGLDQPTAIRVDRSQLSRFAMLAGEPGVGSAQGPIVHLEYRGGKHWVAPNFPPDQSHVLAIRDVGYRVPLETTDVVCCGKPTEPVQPRLLSTLGGEVEWRGYTLKYDLVPLPVRNTFYWDVLFDPRDETILVLGEPEVKPVWPSIPAMMGGLAAQQ